MLALFLPAQFSLTYSERAPVGCALPLGDDHIDTEPQALFFSPSGRATLSLKRITSLLVGRRRLPPWNRPIPVSDYTAARQRSKYDRHAAS